MTAYDWIKALHVAAVMIWMAGMIVLPWLFVIHRERAIGSESSELLKLLEWRLLKVVVNPAMTVAWIAGPYLAWAARWWNSGWFEVKLVLVLVLSGIHGLFTRWVKAFAADRPRSNTMRYRMAATMPIGFLIVVVVLAVAKPF